MLKLNDYRVIHFVGVGGISMRGLAFLCAQNGIAVSGSDIVGGEVLDSLRSHGINAYQGSDTSVVAKAELVVYTASIKRDDKELEFARLNNIPCVERKFFLSMVAKLCDKTVAVAGTHGKTTVCSMTSYTLEKLGAKFISHIGGLPVDNNMSVIDTGRDIFLTEACEYNRSFLSLSPCIGVILNTDYDHPDTYPCQSDMLDAYKKFTEISQQVIVSDMCKLEYSQLDTKKFTIFGLSSNCDYYAGKIENNFGRYSFNVCNKEKCCRITLKVYGKHNIYNALACVAICCKLGFALDEVCQIVSQFNGVHRRFECMGKTNNGARIIIDYAHHPMEISGAIDTARVMTKGKIVVAFEPHTYSRTACLMDEFVESLFWADELVILPTFAAREKPTDGASGFDLYKNILSKGIPCLYIESYERTAEFVEKFCDNEDIILLLGAGNIYKLADMLAKYK